MPLLVHPVPGALAVHREAVELARETDGEVAHVDHLLHLAEPLGLDLPHLEGDELPERLLVLAKLVADVADHDPAHWRGHHPPGLERGQRGLHDLLVVRFARLDDLRDRLAIDRRDAHEFAAGRPVDPTPVAGAGVHFLDTESLQEFMHGTPPRSGPIPASMTV